MGNGGQGYAEAIPEERAMVASFYRAVEFLVEAAGPLWNWGDGYGGYVRATIEEAFEQAGFPGTERPKGRWKPDTRPTFSAVRKTVFERDAYRCRSCGDWIDLTVDHIIPSSLGGTDDIGNLQTLCRKCNSSKGDTL